MVIGKSLQKLVNKQRGTRIRLNTREVSQSAISNMNVRNLILSHFGVSNKLNTSSQLEALGGFNFNNTKIQQFLTGGARVIHMDDEGDLVFEHTFAPESFLDGIYWDNTLASIIVVLKRDEYRSWEWAYAYYNVPSELIDEWREIEYGGYFYNDEIKGQYTSVRIR